MRCEYIDHMGDDLRVVNAARVSFDKESEWDTSWYEHPKDFGQGFNLPPRLLEKDEKLIRYLAKHGHWTPFAQCEVQMRETVPIFVARQRFKHMVGFVYNEVSRRYVDDEPEFFEPKAWRSRPEASIKQGSGEPFGIHENAMLKNKLSEYHKGCLEYYNYYLEAGVAPEQARMVLPQSMYTSYYVKGSLAAWARAYNQRIDRNKAQNEIADLAEMWDHIIQPLFPISWRELTNVSE